MFVGAQVIDPELVGLRFLGGGFAVGKEDVGFKASPARTDLRVEDAGRQGAARCEHRLV